MHQTCPKKFGQATIQASKIYHGQSQQKVHPDNLNNERRIDEIKEMLQGQIYSNKGKVKIFGNPESAKHSDQRRKPR